jgi:hypothetical protein
MTNITILSDSFHAAENTMVEPTFADIDCVAFDWSCENCHYRGYWKTLLDLMLSGI